MDIYEISCALKRQILTQDVLYFRGLLFTTVSIAAMSQNYNYRSNFKV